MSTFLSCERLLSNLCTIGDYVIEWRLDARDGTIVFVTGEGTDPAIQAQHPFYDEVVFAGTLYPIIRYAYINGNKYTAYYEEGALYSPDFITCLNPVIVEAVDCNTVLGTDVNYPYYLTYNNINDVGQDKSRSIKFDISSDTTYFAWRFFADDVAEQLKIYYCTLLDPVGTLVDNFIIGTRGIGGVSLATNLYPVSYPTDARIYNPGSMNVFFISDLTGFSYTSGDYLRIRIEGGVYEPLNKNTSWQFACKCLTEVVCDFYSTDVRKIDGDPTMSYVDDPSCYYKVVYNTLDILDVNYISKTSSAYFIYIYLNMRYIQNYNPVSNSYNNPIGNGLIWAESTNSGWIWYDNRIGYGSYDCRDLASGETISISRDTDWIMFTFTDIDDYDEFVSNISSIQSSAGYTSWLTYNNTQVGYFAYYQVRWLVANSCGDEIDTYNLYFHFSSTIDYDAINKTIKFNINIPLNGIVDSDCSDYYDSANSYITRCNNTKNWTIPVGKETSSVKNGCCTGYGLLERVLSDEIREIYFEFYIHEVLLNNICDLSALGFCFNNSSKCWEFYRYWDKFTLTEPSTHESRLCNWKLERKVFLRTDDCDDYTADTWETVYESVCPTTTTTTTSP